MELQASEMIAMLQKHIAEHGDGAILLAPLGPKMSGNRFLNKEQVYSHKVTDASKANRVWLHLRNEQDVKRAIDNITAAGEEIKALQAEDKDTKQAVYNAQVNMRALDQMVRAKTHIVIEL